MLPRRLVGQLLAGQLLVAAAAVAALVAVAGRLTAGVVLLGLGIAAIAVVTAAATGRVLARPLRGLSRTVERLAETITPRRTWTAEAADLTELTAELARMSSRLRERLDELTEERDRAGQILDALEDGMLLLDGAGRLLVANPTARGWFGLADDLRSGLPARRVLGVPQIGELAAAAASKRAPVSGIVTVVFPEDRTLSVRAFPLADRGLTGRIVVTMADITQRHRVEVLRRDFVANASHELKTPVAAVRALAETLQTALPDDLAAARRMAGRIGRETERLDALVRDLLDLSRVERGTLAVEPVDLTGLAKEVLGSHASSASTGSTRRAPATAAAPASAWRSCGTWPRATAAPSRSSRSWARAPPSRSPCRSAARRCCPCPADPASRGTALGVSARVQSCSGRGAR